MPSFGGRTGAAGNFHVRRDDVIAGRYRVTDEAGKGNFARVLKAYDMKEDRMVAVKILRREYQRDAQFEHEILQAINRQDADGAQKVCKMESHFMWGDLPCFVFGLLGQSVKSCNYGPKETCDEQVADFAKQVCSTLGFLHFTCKMVHTDLKPENILLDRPVSNVKSIGDGWAICDLGSASFYSAKPDQDLIQTRPYRAPEVVLGCPWSYAVDMWSIGCILYELKKGVKLFDAMNDEQHLIMFEKRVGKVPSWLVRSAHPKNRRQFFDGNDRLIHSQSVFSNPYGRSASVGTTLTEELADEPDFLDFLMRCFAYDPLARMRADEAAHHPWVRKYFNVSSKDGLLRKLPVSGYTAGAIKTPGARLLNGEQPLTKEQQDQLLAQDSARPAAAQHNGSAPNSRSSSPPVGVHRLGSAHSDVTPHLARQASAALAPHLAPAAGMPSAGRLAAQHRNIVAPVRPMPPREPSHYVTSSSTYGSSVRAYPTRGAIPAPSATRRPTPYMTPPTF